MNWQGFWQKKGITNIVLLPLSLLFYILVRLRWVGYRLGLFKSSKPDLPIIIVGNINIGGTGKTPLLIALGKLLAKNNINYAVISKGYGGSYDDWHDVQADDLANIVGDEPLLIKLKLDCPVIVAKNRYQATQLIKKYYPQIQIILSDDGLQHYRLQRDIEIAVISARQGLGNGWLLPAGPLREPASRLKSVDFVISNGISEQFPYHYQLRYRHWTKLGSGERRSHDEFEAETLPCLAISGIANPDNFFTSLQQLGIECKTLAYPDHYRFKGNELMSGNVMLITEKDWVKLKEFTHDNTWCLVVDAELSEALKSDIMASINNLLSKSECEK